MVSPRLAAFLAELQGPLEAHRSRAEALILRVPGEGQPALTADAEARVLMEAADGLSAPVRGWVQAVKALAEVERGWGSTERAREAARRFHAATDAFLGAWEHLLRVQPATEPMRRVLGLAHAGCYELFLSGPAALLESCADIASGRAEARLAFEPEAPSLGLATQELRRLASARR